MQTVYVLELEGVKSINLDIDSLCDRLKTEFEESSEEDVKDFNFQVYTKEMTGSEIDELPEFECF